MRWPAIFLDDGGVMNDNARRAAQWRRLVAEFLAPRLGGAPAAWERANHVVAHRIWNSSREAMRRDPDLDAALNREAELLQWLGGMCDEVGVRAPSDREACLELAAAASAYVTRRVRAAYPGAVEAIRTLRAAGFSLYTASGEHSADLEGYLEGMGVRRCFATLYGPDLVRCAKASPRYYISIFAHAGVAPEDALVVDDGEEALDWAATAGARTVLCGPNPPASSGHGHVDQLAQLRELIVG